MPYLNDFFGVVEEYSQLDPVKYQYFDNLFSKRTVILNEEIGDNFFETVVLPLINFEKDDSTAPVTLYLNTAGGSVASGLILCSIIDNYKKPLNIIVPSFSCSMGTICLCAGNKNPNATKYAYQFSFALFHSGSVLVQGEATSAEDIMEFNKSLDVRIRDYVLANTNIDAETYDSHNRKQWYITSDQMVKYGLVDKIIGSEE